MGLFRWIWVLYKSRPIIELVQTGFPREIGHLLVDDSRYVATGVGSLVVFGVIVHYRLPSPVLL